MKKDIIIILATSGAGLGHLTRAIAIAKRLRAEEKKIEILFVTSSNALEFIRREGFLFFYIPSKPNTSKVLSDIEWTELVEKSFRMLITYYKPRAVIYDAAFPYWMIYRVLQEEKVSKTIWIKRECYRDGLEYLSEYEKEFGLIIMPKELPNQKCTNTDRKKYVNPIVILDQEEFYDRAAVRERYGIKEELAVYIQLGVGMLCDVSNLTNQVIKEVMKQKQVHLVLGQLGLGSYDPLEIENVTILKEYPACKFFRGMDLAITAVGYNTVHELLACRLPALFIPNQLTVVDDQCKRARIMKEQGYGIYMEESDLLTQRIEQLFKEREKMQSALADYDSSNGVKEAIGYILNYIESSGGEA